MSNVLMITSLKESYSPPFGIHHLQTFPWGMGGSEGAPSIKTGNLTGLIFYRYCANYHIYSDFIHSEAMPFPEVCISQLPYSSIAFTFFLLLLQRFLSCGEWEVAVDDPFTAQHSELFMFGILTYYESLY